MKADKDASDDDDEDDGRLRTAFIGGGGRGNPGGGVFGGLASEAQVAVCMASERSEGVVVQFLRTLGARR